MLCRDTGSNAPTQSKDPGLVAAPDSVPVALAATTAAAPVQQEEEEPLMQAFNIIVQILISQCLEPGFLSAIQQQNGMEIVLELV